MFISHIREQSPWPGVVDQHKGPQWYLCVCFYSFFLCLGFACFLFCLTDLLSVCLDFHFCGFFWYFKKERCFLEKQSIYHRTNEINFPIEWAEKDILLYVWDCLLTWSGSQKHLYCVGSLLPLFLCLLLLLPLLFLLYCVQSSLSLFPIPVPPLHSPVPTFFYIFFLPLFFSVFSFFACACDWAQSINCTMHMLYHGILKSPHNLAPVILHSWHSYYLCG